MRSSSRFLSGFVTVTGNLFLSGGTLLWSVLAILVSPIPPATVWTFGVGRLWSRGILTSSGVRLKSFYDPRLDPAASYVFLCNHQSLFDIPVILVSSPGQVRLVAKRSLFRLPVFGWSMHAGGFIPVDRGDRSSAGKTFAAAIAKLRKGTSILLFPEGTRSQTDELLPFERGGFLLALKTGLPIVPVGIRGTRSIRHRGSFAIHPGEVEIRYGAPLDPKDYGLRRKDELIAEVRRQIAELAAIADAEAPVPGISGTIPL